MRSKIYLPSFTAADPHSFGALDSVTYQYFVASISVHFVVWYRSRLLVRLLVFEASEFRSLADLLAKTVCSFFSSNLATL